MKYIIFFILANTAMAMIPADKLHKISERNGELRNKECVSFFKETVESGIKQSSEDGMFSFKVRIHYCMNDLEVDKLANKYIANGYKVTIKDREFLIEW